MTRKEHIALDEALKYITSPRVIIEDKHGDFAAGLKIIHKLLGIKTRGKMGDSTTSPFDGMLNFFKHQIEQRTPKE